MADLYIGAGALDRAVAVLIPALEETKDADLALRLVRASPERASSELAALLSDGIFTASSLADLGLPVTQSDVDVALRETFGEVFG